MSQNIHTLFLSKDLFISNPIVYIIKLEINKKDYFYIGRTVSINGSGVHISSPFKRLTKHLFKNGNTSRVFENQKFIDLKADYDSIFFYYYHVKTITSIDNITINDMRHIENEERWLIKYFSIKHPNDLLNDKILEPEQTVSISDNLKDLYKAATGMNLEI